MKLTPQQRIAIILTAINIAIIILFFYLVETFIFPECEQIMQNPNPDMEHGFMYTIASYFIASWIIAKFYVHKPVTTLWGLIFKNLQDLLMTAVGACIILYFVFGMSTFSAVCSAF